MLCVYALEQFHVKKMLNFTIALTILNLKAYGLYATVFLQLTLVVR